MWGRRGSLVHRRRNFKTSCQTKANLQYANMEFGEAANRVHMGRSLLFVGAGFSFGAKSIADLDLVDARGFANRLCAEIGETDLPLDIATDEYLEQKSYRDIFRRLHDQFDVKSNSKFHEHIVSLPWRRIYTTNFDNLLEFSSKNIGISRGIATLSDDPQGTLSENLTIHLNGFVDKLSEDNFNKDFILTDDQYLGEKFRLSPWSEVFRMDLEICDSIFFLGYSLYDFDIARILFENPNLIRKTFLGPIYVCDLTSLPEYQQWGYGKRRCGPPQSHSDNRCEHI
jgi:SIR2-like domain